MRVFVTGGTGFIGGALVRKLLEAGHEVRALVRPGANTLQIDNLNVEVIPGHLLDKEALLSGMKGCDWVFHVAALYTFWGYKWSDFLESNVEGTKMILQAARESNVRKIVYTSSIAALGRMSDNKPADESTPSFFNYKIGFYQRSKFMAEQVVLKSAKNGLPVIIVNPSTPVGPGDHKPTPTGQIIVDYLNGRIPAFVDTGLNIVDVDDVAVGHILTAQLGRIGEKYILGGENLTLKQILYILAELTGLPKPRWQIPHNLALVWAFIDSTVAVINKKHLPTATPDKVRLSRHYEFFDTSKAVRELGMPQTSAREALRKAVKWYLDNGYVKSGRKVRLKK